jgi:hypothetical protein
MFCLACGEPDKEPNVNCVHCGQNWLEHEVDTNLQKGLEQLAKIYFISKDVESANFLEKLDKLRSKFKISSAKWGHALEAFYEYKDRLSALSGLELTFNESLQDAYAKHDTNLEFLLLNNTEDFIEAHIYWDDLDTPDELDLNIKTYEAIAPKDTVLLSGDHVFARAGRKTITDLTLTIKNFEGEEVQFTVAPFKIDIEISPENITQQNINKISVKGRNVVDASNVSQNSKSKLKSKETWLHLKLIPNTNGLIESLAGSNDKEIASSKLRTSEDIRDPVEPLERKMHINPEGNKNKDFYPEFEDHILDILEKNRKKTSESEKASLFPEIDLSTMNSWSNKVKAVSKIPDHDYPVFDKPYYEEYPDGEIKHFRLPMMAKFSNFINTTSEECISFFYDKVETLGLYERTTATNSANDPDQRILRIAWGTETATDRFSVVYVSEDGGDAFEQIYFVHDLKDHHWSTIIEVTAPSDESYCYHSAFSSRDLPMSHYLDDQRQYSNGYIDKLSGNFRKLPNWSRIHDVESEFYPKEMNKLADCDNRGYMENDTKVSKLRQWGNEGVLHEHFPYLKIYPQFDRRSIYGEITMGAKINDHFVGLAEQFDFLFVYRSDCKWHYEKSINNAIGLNLEKINCMSATIAQISEPLENVGSFEDACRGYIKTYNMWVMNRDGMEILPQCGVGFASSMSILVDETSSQTGLIKNELTRWSQNRNGSFNDSIKTPMFFIYNMENDDDIELSSPFWEDNKKISPEIFSFIGAKQANGSRNYFSNPESIVLRALQKIKEIEAGRPAFKLLDQVTAYRSSLNDHHKHKMGDMLDNARARKQFTSKPGKLSWMDLGNVWIDPS